MEARLKAILEMDASQLEKELVDIGKEMNKFEKELSKTKDTSEIEALTAKIAQLEQAMTLVIGTMNKVGTGMADIGNRVSKVEKDFSSANSGTDILAKSMMQLDASVNRVGAKLDLLAPSIGKVGATAASTAANVASVATASGKAAKSTEAVGGAMKKSGVDTQNFARVIQDLPFGFMGIQNNLTQLIPGIGAAGLAFSALTAAITFSQVGLSYWQGRSSKVKESADETAKAIKSMAESYAQEKGQLDTLYQTATNDNQSRQLRLNAVKGLRDNYGAYLKNFSDEEILAGKAATAYTNLANAIMMKARASAAQSKIDKIVAGNLENELKIIDRMAKAQEEVNKIKGSNTVRISGGTGGLGTEITYTEQERKNIVWAKASKDVKEYSDNIADASSNLKFLQDQVQSNQIAPFTEDKPTGGTTKTPKGKKPFDNARFASKMQAWQNESLAPAPAVKDNTKDTSQKPVKDSLDDPVYWANLAKAKALNNQQILDLAAFSEYAGQAVGQMVNAMMNGENIGDVLANAFKQIAVQIAAAVAQALIFAALLDAFPALKGVFATVGAVVGNGGGGGGSILGNIKGQDIQLSNARTSTGMGLRVGRTY